MGQEPHQQQALGMFWGKTPQPQHHRGGVFSHPVPLSWRRALGGGGQGRCPHGVRTPLPRSFTAMPAAVSDERMPRAADTHPRGLLSHSSLFLSHALRGRTAPARPWKWKPTAAREGGSRSTLGTAAGCIPPPLLPFPTEQWRCPGLAPRQRGHGVRRCPVLPGRCRCPGRCWLGRGGAVVELPWVPHGELRVAHGCRCGVAAGGRFLRRFPLVEPGLGALGAAASFGSAQPLEVAKHLDVVGTQRAQRRRGAAGVLPLPRAARGPGGHAPARGAQPGGRVCRVFPGRLRGHAVQSETSPVLGAALPSLRGDCLLWYRGAAPSIHGLCLRGLTGGDQLHLPPPAADPAHGRPGAHHLLPPQQHRQPGHLRGVSHHHAGLDDALAAPQPAARAPGNVHCGHSGHGNHDAHEHHPLLPPAA
ncbi:TLC domain-containing protein 2 isoform X1 [Anser cygnoides]|uniref:TLC domain-containing protein 2 isoform X1 n=1 Tax=Anser cygnoides TaxID=8845 RepID=UPI0034D3414B